MVNIVIESACSMVPVVFVNEVRLTMCL